MVYHMKLKLVLYLKNRAIKRNVRKHDAICCNITKIRLQRLKATHFKEVRVYSKRYKKTVNKDLLLCI